MRLWERLSGSPATSPFGVILRLAPGSEAVCPWRSWRYRSPTMPGLNLEIAVGTALEEPMWCYLSNGRAPVEVEHPAGVQTVTHVRIACPEVAQGSVTRAMADAGVIELAEGTGHLLELQFDGGRRGVSVDFLPDLPLILHT